MNPTNDAEQWREVSKGTIKARHISSACTILYCEKTGIYPDIGEGTWIGHYTVLDGIGRLTIGKNCSIASGVQIYTHSTHDLVANGNKKLVAPTEIGDNVVIGANSIILHGCKIHSNTVIPALTVLKPHTEIGKTEHSC